MVDPAAHALLEAFVAYRRAHGPIAALTATHAAPYWVVFGHGAIAGAVWMLLGILALYQFLGP